MVYNATSLRKNIYSVLDSVLESGVPVEIERNGKKLRIVSDEAGSRLSRLQPHKIVNGNSDKLAELHWNDSWNGTLPD